MACRAAGSFIGIAALALSACGGGTAEDANVQRSAGLASIDSLSAPDVAAAVAGAIAGSERLAMVGGFSVPKVSTSFASLGRDAPQILASAIGPETVGCAASGSVTLSGVVAIPAASTAGDLLVFEFANCDEAQGAVLDGSSTFEIVAFAGDVARGMITLTVSMTLDQFRYNDNSAGGSMNGNLSFTIDTTNVPEEFVAVSSSSFVMADSGASATLGDFIMTLARDPAQGTARLDSSSTLNSDAFDGELSYVTTQTLVFADSGGPESGEIVVSGAGGAKLTMRILSVDHIELEIDLDGNATVDEIIVTSWAELIG